MHQGPKHITITFGVPLDSSGILYEDVDPPDEQDEAEAGTTETLEAVSINEKDPKRTIKIRTQLNWRMGTYKVPKGQL